MGNQPIVSSCEGITENMYPNLWRSDYYHMYRTCYPVLKTQLSLLTYSRGLMDPETPNWPQWMYLYYTTLRWYPKLKNNYRYPEQPSLEIIGELVLTKRQFQKH